MTVEVCDKVSIKLLATRKRTAALGSEPISLLPTTAAISYFAGQAKDRQIFDEQEKINTEFREAVRTFTSYPDWYTLPVYYLDCLEEIWNDRCKENPMLEKDCIHGENCQKINNCNCTPDWEVQRNIDIQKQKHRLEHNIKRKPKLSKKQKKQQERWNKEGQFEDWKKKNWDPTMPMEDSEE
jgi:hypothetical protein